MAQIEQDLNFPFEHIKGHLTSALPLDLPGNHDSRRNRTSAETMVYRSREFSHMAFPNHQEGIDRFYLGTNTFYMPIWALTGVVRGSHDEMAAKVRKLTLESCLWFSRVGLVEALRRFPNVTHITLELPVGGVTAYAYASDVETCNGEDVGIDDLADIEQMHLIQAFMYDIDKNLDKLRETQIIIIGEDGQRYDSLYPGYPTWVRGVERQFQRWIYEGRRGAKCECGRGREHERET